MPLIFSAVDELFVATAPEPFPQKTTYVEDALLPLSPSLSRCLAVCCTRDPGGTVWAREGVDFVFSHGVPYGFHVGLCTGSLDSLPCTANSLQSKALLRRFVLVSLHSLGQRQLCLSVARCFRAARNVGRLPPTAASTAPPACWAAHGRGTIGFQSFDALSPSSSDSSASLEMGG